MAKSEKNVVVEVEKGVRIFVNGTPKVVLLDDLSPDGEISFDDIVRLAFDPVPTGEYVEFEVTFAGGAGRPREGRVTEGQSVKIKDETSFNVGYTDGA